MSTRREHLEKAADLIGKASVADQNTRHESATRLREQAKAHTDLAEAMRPTRPVFGATRQERRERR